MWPRGRLVVRTLLTASRYRPRSLLVTEAALRSVQDLFDGGQDDEVPLFLATPACMREIIGFNVHRGCLALGERPAELSMADVLPAGSNPRLVVRSKGSAMPTTSAACFEMPPRLGADAVLLSPGCCDPLYRKAIRVSMGASLSMPFAPVADWPDGLAALRERGFSIVALTPGPGRDRHQRICLSSAPPPAGGAAAGDRGRRPQSRREGARGRARPDRDAARDQFAQRRHGRGDCAASLSGLLNPERPPIGSGTSR